MTKKQKKNLYRIVIATVLVVLFRFLPLGEPWKLLLFMIPYLVVGYDILKKAVRGIFHGQVFDENFLMAVATVGAILLGDYAEGVAVMLFYQIGELFQSVAVGRSRNNITALMDICPDYANMEDEEGNLVQVDPDEVPVGSIIVIKPGEKIPIDGVVVEGNGTLDTSALTGESVPREVEAGGDVISGCINLSGLLKVRTTKEFGESTVSKILELVENSGMKKSRPEKFITRFARIYTPAVCLAALLLAVIPPLALLALGRDPMWFAWLRRGLIFLVISCPCALVISIPLSFFGGIGGASSCGVLVKGSNYLEALSKVKYVVFDKTGTLTRGVFEVTDVCPGGEKETDEDSKEELLKYAAHAEYFSDHPISKSLRDAYEKPIDSGSITDVQEISGHGVKVKVDGVDVAAGNEKLMKQMGLDCPGTPAHGTVVHVAVDGEHAGYILIADQVKKDAKEALADLKAVGVKKNVMLTGDRKGAADHVARELGVDEVRSELLPGDKVAEVEKLLAEKKAGENLVFVGDGINDAPVLTRADIGIAMGALGSDAAIEAADVVLMDDDPAKIAKAIRIARKCMRIVYENIGFSLTVKGVFLLLGALGIANMWMAIFADVGVMIIAVLNATRCLRVK